MNSELSGVVYGLLSATLWGAGDFSGGLATKRNSAYSVVIAAQVFGSALLAIIAALVGDDFPPSSHVLWAGLAGIVGGIGLTALYRALASSQMGIAAPFAALITAVIPVIFSAMTVALPSVLDWIGFALALIGVWLVSRPQGETSIRLADLGLPLLAGCGFGAFFILLDRATDESLLWGLFASRLASLSTLLAIATLISQPRVPNLRFLPLVMLAGFLDTTGNAFFALAAQAGRLDIASITSSLYPASTVFLAFLILNEKLSRLQWCGIAGMLGAILLIAA